MYYIKNFYVNLKYLPYFKRVTSINRVSIFVIIFLVYLVSSFKNLLKHLFTLLKILCLLFIIYQKKFL